ncbi:MAG: replicative DNA helicase [Bacillota bacterium]
MSGLSSERIPPNSLEAEQSVLGCLLIDRQAVATVMEELREEDFYREAHREAFAAATSLYARGEPVDLITLVGELRTRAKLEQVGGLAYLTDLAQLVPTAANVSYYVRLVREKAVLRQLIGAATQVAAMSYEGGEPADTIVDQAEKLILEVSQRRSTNSYAHIGEVLFQTYEQLDQLLKNKGTVSGVPTGFNALDRLTAGFQPSDLIILAARPGVGKTTIMLNVAQYAAMHGQVPTVIFSLEMSKDQLAQRMLCAEANVDLYKLRNGFLETSDWEKITKAIGPLSAAPIYIDDTAAISVMELRSKVRRLKLEHNIGLVVIDYLQLMTLGAKSESRQQEVSTISRALKAMAKELNVPVIAGSQLSRAVEQRQDKRPMLSDLLESGGIEANADLVTFLYRDDYYNPDTEKPNTAEVIIAKQRNGPVGTVELYFLKNWNKFVNMDRPSGGAPSAS